MRFKSFLKLSCIFAGVLGLFSALAFGQTVAAPYADIYSAVDLGSIPGVPANYGGLTVKLNEPNTLLIGGSADGSSGALYSVAVNRDDEGHITGFSGPATYYADAPYVAGGVAFWPDSTLFVARWPVNQLGQIKPGSHTMDKVIDLGAMGVAASVSGLGFVPSGFGNADNHLKLLSHSGGQWYDATFSPDGVGTYNLDSLTHVPGSTLGGGPTSLAYVPMGSDLLPYHSVLISEFTTGKIAVYEVDADANPILSTRSDFITGLTGADGAAIDPITGDFLFSTFGGGNRVIVVRGFIPEPATLCLCAAGAMLLRRRWSLSLRSFT